MASKKLIESVVNAASVAGIETTAQSVAFTLGYSTAMNAPRLTTAPIRVYYHEGISGRAQSAFLLLADAGMEHERRAPADITDPTIFAVPAVECGGEWRSQTLSVMRFLAEKTGYEVPAHLSTLAEKLCLDIADIWSEVYGQAVQNRGVGIPESWVDQRLTKWLRCVNATIDRHGSGAFCFGKAISFADFLLLNVVMVLEFTIGEDNAQRLISSVAPCVASVTAATRERPKVAAYLNECGEEVLHESVKAP